jgi:hypothetical protein
MLVLIGEPDPHREYIRVNHGRCRRGIHQLHMFKGGGGHGEFEVKAED